MQRLYLYARSLGSERGQGTVEYVGLILLVSLLMVGMVAAMKGFNRSFRKTRNLQIKDSRGSSGGGESSPFLSLLVEPRSLTYLERLVFHQPQPPRFLGSTSTPCI